MDKISNLHVCGVANPYSLDAGRRKIFSGSEFLDGRKKEKYEEMQQLSLLVQQLIPLEQPRTSATSPGVDVTDDANDKLKLSKCNEIDTFNSLHDSTLLTLKNGDHARSTDKQVLVPFLQLHSVNDELNALNSNGIAKNKNLNSYEYEVRASIPPQMEEDALQQPLQEKITEIQHRLDKSVANLTDDSGSESLSFLEDNDKVRQVIPPLQDKDKVLDSSLHRRFMVGQLQTESTTIFSTEGEKARNGEFIYRFRAWGDQHAVRISHHPSQNHSQLLFRPSSNLVEQRLNDQVTSSDEKWIVQSHQDQQKNGAKYPWTEEEDDL